MINPLNRRKSVFLSESRKERLRKVLQEIGQGKSPQTNIFPNQQPTFWVIRTTEEPEVENRSEELWSFEEGSSTADLEYWITRGGRTEVVRTGGATNWAAARLIHLKTGETCVGLNFPGASGNQHFMIVREQWMTNNGALRKALIRRGASHIDDNVMLILRNAPCIVILSDVQFAA